MFAWKLASKALAPNSNKKARHIIDSLWMTLAQTVDRNLEMQHMQLWVAHMLELFLQKFGRNGIYRNETAKLQNTGSDWFLIILNDTPVKARAALLVVGKE